MLVQPGRARRVGDDEDASYPRREQVDAAKCVLELVDLSVARLGIIPITDNVALHAKRPCALELDRCSIDPGEDHVDVEGDVCCVRLEHSVERRPVATVTLDGGIERIRSR